MRGPSQPIGFPHKPLDMVPVYRSFKTALGHGKTRLDPDIFREVGLEGVKGQGIGFEPNPLLKDSFP